MEVFHLEDVSFSYPGAQAPALSGVTLSVRGGEFVVLCGQSGCGKTTLLRLLKRELTPHGARSGRIWYGRAPLEEADGLRAAGEIGYVAQNPESQAVTDKVWHELAFGLENLGLPTPVIRRRVAEMASFFGIQDWFRRPVRELSGGQKQLLNLASVMVMQPKVLILDEPTSQLDPIAASEFIAALYKLNQELGLTILLAEHRLEEVFPLADRVLVLEEGKAAAFAPPREISGLLRGIREAHPMQAALPSAVRIFGLLSGRGESPLTVKEGRDWLGHFCPQPAGELRRDGYAPSPEAAVECKNVWFRYERDLPDVLRGVSFRVAKGEIYCLLGGNGTGKTTALHVLSGLRRPYRGKVKIGGKPIGAYQNGALYRQNLALLPQNPQTVFLRGTVREDYGEIGRAMGWPKEETDRAAREMAEKLGITHLLQKHPYDLSGGEQQKCALGKVLLLRPQILLLDEPTKGLDAFAKESLREILRELKAGGMTLILVTHDVEFACEAADRCAMFFDGEIVSEDMPGIFFARNNFYTTAANRIARNLAPGAVTCAEVARCCAAGDRAGEGGGL